MIVEDFVMLGKTVPEATSDGRVFVCSAGVSANLDSLIRIYPLARRGAPRRWSINRVGLERNLKDSRQESWKLAGTGLPVPTRTSTLDSRSSAPCGRRRALACSRGTWSRAFRRRTRGACRSR